MNMKDKVHVVMVADKAYEKGLEVAKASMIGSCSDPDRIEFHIFREEPELSERMRREFGTYRGSPMTFVRLYLGELLPDVDWLVYSDVDTVWRRDVLELASLFDESKTIQWVKNFDWAAEGLVRWCRERSVPTGDFVPERYACAGVCIMNLKRWRERDVLLRCQRFVQEYGCPKYPDQDIQNIVLASEAGLLPSWWDVLIPTPEDTKNCVLHLISVGQCFQRPYNGRVPEYLYWEHLARGRPFKRPLALPFYVRRWFVRLCFPFLGKYSCERIRRRLAWRWFLCRVV